MRMKVVTASRTCTNIATRMHIWMKIASAAITMNASSQPDIACLRTLRDLRFSLVGFLAGIDRGGESILLARHDFLAAFEQVFRSLAQFTGFLLCVVAAFVGFLREIFPRLIAGLRGVQKTHQCADTQSDQK